MHSGKLTDCQNTVYCKDMTENTAYRHRPFHYILLLSADPLICHSIHTIAKTGHNHGSPAE